MKELWAHQKEAIEKAKYLNDFALLADPGLGKSRTLIEIVRFKYGIYGGIQPTIIFAPLITIHKWKDEWLKFSQVPATHIVVLEGPTAHRAEIYKKKWKELGGQVIFITNYESLLSDKFIDAVLYHPPKIQVYDESHKLKDPGSKRTKRAIALSKFASHRYLLTGTPVLNSLMDIFSQWQILDGGATFGANFWAWKNRYFYDLNAYKKGRAGYFPNWKVQKESVAFFNQEISKKSMVAKKSECLDLPPFIEETYEVELGEEQRDVYDQMKKDFIAYLNDKACVTTLAITKALRLQQIVAGYIPLESLDENNVPQTELEIFEDNPRIKALEELLEQITPSNKVIIWTVFRATYPMLREVCENLNIKYVEAHGEISAKEKFEAVRKFNSEPDVKVFIGHPESLGIGIDLIAASYSIFYSRNFSLGQDIQAEARNYRGGSEIHSCITRIDLVARGTIDSLIKKALANKEKIGEEVLRTMSSQI